MGINETALKLYEGGNRKIKVFYNDGEIEIRRIGINGRRIILMDNRSRRYGNFIGNFEHRIREIKPIESRKTPEEKWQHNIKRAIRLLESSGLWSDMLNDYKTALSIGYDNLNKAYNQYWERDENMDYNEKNKKNIEDIRKIDGRLIDSDGNIKTSILWYMIHITIKKMNFGYNTEAENKRIQEAIDKKESYRTDARSNYDISFEYSPEKNIAWYSEEYKNCGNGHYYLALDNKYAVFYEDD
jgi:hypothetical protein